MSLGSREAAFLGEAFQAYYKTRPAYRVDQVAAREWMFISSNGRVRRHLSFPDVDALHEALIREVPWHVHHSMAYYEDPACADMPSKDRHGCDVFLDLDVKPEAKLDGTGTESLEEALGRAKQRFLHVLDLLEHDLGIPFRDLEVCFSGSKGYHARLPGDDYAFLDAEARLELGRFISGAGATLRRLFPGPDSSKPLIPAKPPPGGLPRRVWMAMTRLKKLSDPQHRPPLLAGLVKRHLGDLLASPGEVLDAIHAISLQDLVDDEEQREILRILYHTALEQACPPIDLQVLGDLTRVGRLQGSINGKTGLVAAPLASRQDVESFSPLADASPYPGKGEQAVATASGVRLLPSGTAIHLLALGQVRFP